MIHAARSATNEEFREARLERIVRATGILPPGEVVRRLIRELLDHHEGTDLDDDAVAVCLDCLAPR